MPTFIGTLIIGIICCILGISNMQGNISSLHSYHRHRVSEEDRIPFGRKVGLGTLIIGLGIVIFGGLSAAAMYTQKDVLLLSGTVILIVSLVVGLALSFYAMIKYNKGIF